MASKGQVGQAVKAYTEAETVEELLSIVEPGRAYHPFILGAMPPQHAGLMMAAEVDALAESLAAVTADGGPLDQLAKASLSEAVRSTATAPWDPRIVESIAYVGISLRNDMALFADPIILAGQRDLDVLRAYAAQAGA